ncbi:centlein isoform X2 [Hydra vulgaris]|uniref:centlein isoform X2 n=1 Tax=Hydra vulgaris TaxID=6087 RepID=UPI001F5FEDB8|nr:centlein isoform X2 [Hydra vulgaris]
MDVEKGSCPVVEFTYEELMIQNKSLSEELALCQKDKDFVWDLWKSLQEEKPDIAEIISKVVEREQEKSDVKDLKVLLVLQQKDIHIKNLEEKSLDLQTQLKNVNERLSSYIVEEQKWNENLKRFEIEKERLTKEIEVLAEKLRVKESHSNIMETEAMSRISKLQHKNADLHENMHNLQKEISSLNESLFSKDAIIQTTSIQMEAYQASAEQKIHEKQVELDILKKEKEDYLKKFEKLELNLQEHETKLLNQVTELKSVPDMFDKINNLQAIISEQEKKITCKDAELLELRNSMSNHLNCSNHISEQSNLIKKLQNLQDETQNVIAKQKADHQLELKSLENKINELVGKTQMQQKLFSKLTEENKGFAANCKKCLECETQLANLQKKYNLLIKKYKESLSFKKKYQKIGASSNLPHSSTTLSEFIENNSTELSKEKVNKLKKLIKTMGAELSTLQSSYKQMQQGYNVLQQNYDLVLQQLKTYKSSPKIQPLKDSELLVQRTFTKSFQNEDTHTVNELEYFHKECKKLNFDREKLLLEIDSLQVKSSHDLTVINQLELQVFNLKKTLQKKEEEHKITQINTQKQQKIWEEKLNGLKEEMFKIKAASDAKNDEISSLSIKLASVTSELSKCIKSTVTSFTQTNELFKEEELFRKMNEVIDFVYNDRVTNQSPSKISCNISTQTFKEKNLTKETQTDFILVVENKEINKKKKSDDAKHLVSYNTENHENRSLKKRVLSLENQVFIDIANHKNILVFQLRESKNSLNKLVLELESSNAKLKEDLVTTLQKLQVSKEYLQARNIDLENCTRELNTILEEQQRESINSKSSAAALKVMENKLRICTEECSKHSFHAKTTKQENDMLTEKLKVDQEKIAMLEKNLNQKKDIISELKEKNITLKKENKEYSVKCDHLKEQLKEANELEKKSKLYAETLKEKKNALTKEISTLRASLAECKLELQNKTHLLEESQHLCKQAELAINEMEKSAFQHLKSQQKLYDETNQILSTRCENLTININELKKGIKIFTESILTQIHSYRSYSESTRKLSTGTQDAQVDGQMSKAHDLACSILNMSISDLQQFMVAPSEEFPTLHKEKDIREKLELILKKEKNFAEILGRFLLDLVEYSFQLSPNQICSVI